MTRRATTTGVRTREAILRTASDVASVEGLEGLSIGRLAEAVAMSKSGLFAHFGSKEDLQLATIESARERYVAEVLEPALGAPDGVRRLRALCEAFLSYIERRVFPGGCFFASAMAEYDSRAAGPVRDRIAECQNQWLQTLTRATEQARVKRELRPGCEPAQLAFELEAVLLSANWYVHLYADDTYLSRARRAVDALLAREATRAGIRVLDADRSASTKHR